MEEGNQSRKRRAFRWSGAARETARAYLNARRDSENSRQGIPTDLKSLIGRLVEVSGNPRDACLRFVRQFGIREKQSYREWTNKEQQQLLDLIVSHPLHEVSLLLRRSPASVRSMLHRLGPNARMGQDWFTPYTLAEALHVRTEQCKSGLTGDGSDAESYTPGDSRKRLSTRLIFVSSANATVPRSLVGG
jgi:hypothetical protein